ncbi:MAG TPA: hypothetical protein VHW95_14790 [Steroidobacteraceae bacterium]|jgi:hypothetical protein|nr:hypothetical protein [Steroidobacteraceae bacterium]
MSRGSPCVRSALLERLLARADDSAPVKDWRADAFHVIAPQAACVPAVGPAVLCADRGATDLGWVCMAAPVHYVAEMSTVRLPQDGMLTLSPAGAETLAADFNRVWQDSGIRLATTRSAQLLCTFDRPLEVRTRDPREALGLEIEEFLPAGPDSGRLRQLISETEMWLFEHAANQTRTDLGLPAVNGLWFWGGGAPLSALPKVQGFVAGDDVFFNALGAGQDEQFASGVIATDGSPGTDRWHDAESRWLNAAVQQLKIGRIAQLRLSAEDRCLTLTARGLRRFWRRKRPWWEFFA